MKNIDSLIKHHINNLKPIVGLNSIRAQKLVFLVLEKLANSPTLHELERKEIIKVKDYNPGQYKTRGVEDEARK